MSKVEIKNVSVGYGEGLVLEDISLDIKDGESLAIVGPSSCGKTTLLRAICGFNKIEQGEIYIGDELVSSAKRKVSLAPERRNIGVVFQDYAVWPHMTVLENVVYPIRKRKRSERPSKKEARKIAMDAIAQVRMEGYEDRLPGQLSGGQQQRVALARAMVSSSSLIMLDEPITNLDATLRKEMSYEIQQLQRELGITIVYITHDLETAMTIADRMAIMNETGDIQQIGTPEEIWTEPINQNVYRFLGVSNFIPVIYEDGVVKHAYLDASIDTESEGLADNHEYMMASRPRDIKLVEAEKDDPGFVAKMKRVVYLGDQFDYFLDLGDQEIRVHQDSYETLQTEVPEEGKYYRLDFETPQFYNKEVENQEIERQVN